MSYRSRPASDRLIVRLVLLCAWSYVSPVPSHWQSLRQSPSWGTSSNVEAYSYFRGDELIHIRDDGSNEFMIRTQCIVLGDDLESVDRRLGDSSLEIIVGRLRYAIVDEHNTSRG